MTIRPAGVDSGFGYMKVVTDDKKIKYHNVSARGIDRFIELTTRETDPTKMDLLKEIDVTFEEAGKQLHFFFGELAADGRNPAYIWDNDRVNTDRARASIFTALALSTEEDEANYAVVTGLPITHFQKYKTMYEKDLPGNVTIHFNSGPLSGISKKITIEKVSAKAQGYGIYLNEIFDISGIPHKDVSNLLFGQLGIIDIGMKTINFTQIRDRIPKDIGCSTVEVGMENVHKAIRNFILKKNGYLEIVDVEGIYTKNKFLTSSNEVIDFTEIKENALIDLANTALQNATQLWNIAAFKKILVAGGGGKAIYNYLNIPEDKKILVEDFQFANALGFFKAAKRMLGKAENTNEQQVANT